MSKSKKTATVAAISVNADVETPAAVFVSFAQYCRDNGLNAKSMRAKLRRYAVSKPHNHSRNYDYNALVALDADLAARRAAAAAAPAAAETPAAE